METLDESVAHIRNLGEQLIPYNFPQADPSLEDHLNNIKTKELLVDGYHVFVHYSKSDYKTHFQETVQMYGKYDAFLPFNVVTKIICKILGNSNLWLVEIIKDSRKIYCWSVITDRRGITMPCPINGDLKVLTYEGLEYIYLDQSNIIMT